MTGKIKNVHTDKGFGFITDTGGVDYFFHQSALKNAKIDDLHRGQEVTFEDADGPKGPRAEDIYI